MNASVASLSPTLRPPLTALKALTPQENLLRRQALDLTKLDKT
jgi:hypothetical protein